ncbi:MAG TPA: hypothetical protein VEM58_16355 [Streptosporangiaceae bacterium]|nr:hypothetical protein [Streptosporangiaceae bacterium]
MSKRKTSIATWAAGAAGLVVIATAALAGCGQVGAGQGAPRAAGSGPRAGQSRAVQSPGQPGAPMAVWSVCADPAAVTSVRVVRLPSRSQLGQTKPVPRKLPSIVIRDRARARGLARLVCGLPKMPHGVYACPVDIGGGYQLIFAAGGRSRPAVTVRASGCESVTGAGPGGVRWAGKSPGFWTRLAKLTGIRAPAHSP